MKKLFAIIFVINLTIITAQSDNVEANSLSLSVILPDNSEHLSRKSISKIESKIQHITTKNGISGRGYTNEFLIYPKLEIFDESVIEGMRNVVVVEVEFSLFIQQYSTKRIFSSYSKSIQGNGFSKEKAVVDAISKIPTNNKEISAFILEGKEKILSYYNNNCDQIVNDSNFLIKTQKFEEAIALLSSVPREAKSCYASIQDKSIEAFTAYQKQTCETNLLRAKTEISNNNYSSALRFLSYVDVSSPCLKEAESLINKVSGKVDQEEKRDWDLMLMRYKDKQNTEKYRLEIMKEIAKAYYNSKPTSITYKSLF
ncbi:hypothetical protein [Winogradskyella sp.]|uniref:hypothetical protein n=1 Tax=Winogradskyella sp. TaxID=1883156 RepID=UPI002604A256|nr:hypothetical protein [Winogradskyella sp.]